jgi:methyl-accepting chemotaxis protein
MAKKNVEKAVVEKVNTPRAPRKKVVKQVVEKVEAAVEEVKEVAEETKVLVEEVAVAVEEAVKAVEEVVVEKTTLLDNIKIAGTRFVQRIFKK